MQFHQTTLANGLTILGEEDKTAHSTSLGVFVKTGARDESEEVSGVSHFLEHMMFKGTAKRSALQLTFDMGNIGAQANAYTSEENTVYYASVLPEYFEQGVEILCDMLRPSLAQEDFDVEKKVILEEIALYQDRPTHVLLEKALQLFFRGHSAGNSVLGSTESITRLQREQMQGYFDRRYTAPNMILAVSGNFEWQRLLDLLSQYCQSWPATKVVREAKAHRPQKLEEVLKKEDLQAAHITLVGLGPSATDEERYSSYLLGAILGDSGGSRTYWSLVDKGLAELAYVDTETMDGTGIVMTYASCAPENLDQVEDVLRSILRTPKDFSAEDLERAKNKFMTRLVLQGESTRRRMMAIGLEWMYRQEYQTLEQEMDRLRNVQRSDIELMLERFPLTPATTVRLLPA